MYSVTTIMRSQGRVVMAWLSDFVLGFRATFPPDGRQERLDEMGKVAFLCRNRNTMLQTYAFRHRCMVFGCPHLYCSWSWQVLVG